MPGLKKIILITFTFFFFSCENSPTFPHAENALDAGREFIDGCLKGEFRQAAFYMQNDTADQAALEALKKKYYTYSEAERTQLGQASIIILQDSTVNDTLHIIQFRNSYDTTNKMIFVALNQDAWQVSQPAGF
ncbi:MAG: hypothetical protein JSS67_04200 [Bacteroidetes bacterium]|nr:hypothetical protein [Bacteroidota bacterium]